MNEDSWTWNEIACEWTGCRDDRERRAVWQLLSLLDDRITQAFVGEQAPTGLDPEELLAVAWSETERMVAEAAVSLYNGSAQVDLGRMARRLSDTQMTRLTTAIAIYRGDQSPSG